MEANLNHTQGIHPSLGTQVPGMLKIDFQNARSDIDFQKARRKKRDLKKRELSRMLERSIPAKYPDASA